MNTINKITLFLCSCIAISHLSTQCFFNGRGPNNAFTGAAIGGLAGGRKGAAIGLGVGAFTDVVGSAVADDNRRRDDDEYYRYKRSKRRRKDDELEDLRRENEELKRGEQAE